MIEAATTLALLLVGHSLADFPQQGDYLAKLKNRFNPLPGQGWYHGLLNHACIHGGFVGVIVGLMTGSQAAGLALGVAEFLVHCLIDDTKCRGKLSYDQDQALHVACKMLWVAALVYWGLLP